MFVVRGTKKFLDRVGRPVGEPAESTSALGDWYANALFWRTQVALFVNAATFLPVLLPLAPASAVIARFPGELATVMDTLGVDPRVVADEVVQMGAAVLAKTASRQVLGVMNEFVFMAEHSISSGRNDSADLLGLSIWLAGTIVGPLTKEDGYTPRGALERWQSTLLGGV